MMAGDFWIRRGCRYCRYCKRFETEKGHDPCIADLPGVVFACCGHGVDREKDVVYLNDDGSEETVTGIFNSCYLMFRDDGLTLYGNAAHAAMEVLGGNPPPFPENVKVRQPVLFDYDDDENTEALNVLLRRGDKALRNQSLSVLYDDHDPL